MDNHQSGCVLLIGVPDAGKSNYLFRLWTMLDRGNGLLVKDNLPPEFEYLRSGAERLLQGVFADHTSEEVHEITSIPIAHRSGNSHFHGTLVVPDVSGEQIISIYQNRRWSAVWEDLIRGETGCLLFLRADSPENVTPIDWATCAELYGGAPAAPPPAEGEVIRPPTQVVLVEWLQYLRSAFTQRVSGSFRPRIGVVVAAWDRVPTDQHTAGPMSYLASCFPMLSDYITSNHDAFEFSVFGLSVVGGDLKSDASFREGYLRGDPRTGGYVVHEVGGRPAEDPDLTLPVAWALRLWPNR
jgi:hypothetical protein